MKKFAIALTLAVSAGASFAGPETVGGTGMLVDVGGAALSGAGRVLRVGSVPVTNVGSTASTYYDAEFLLDVLPDGRLAFIIDTAGGAAGPATTRSSSVLNFQPGKYKQAGGICLWTLHEPSFEGGGARRYSITKDDATCAASSNYPTAYRWSTLAPAAGNGYLDQSLTLQQRVAFTADFAWGTANAYIANVGYGIRATASGGTVNVEGIHATTGAPDVDFSTTFVKQ